MFDGVHWRLIENAGLCWHLLKNVGVCWWRMLMSFGVWCCMLVYAGVYSNWMRVCVLWKMSVFNWESHCLLFFNWENWFLMENVGVWSGMLLSDAENWAFKEGFFFVECECSRCWFFVRAQLCRCDTCKYWMIFWTMSCIGLHEWWIFEHLEEKTSQN